MRRRGPWIIPIVLFLATLLLYWPATGYDFVNYDDDFYVTENPIVQTGLTARSMAWAMTTGHIANWHPITWMSHMLDVSIAGVTPRVHHMTSVMLHSINAALLFVVLLQLTGATWRSALAAALWAMHPLRVESVAWISERKDVLSMMFGLL